MSRDCREKDKRFPLKATCLAIYSRTVNAGEPWKTCCSSSSPGARNGKISCATCVGRTAMGGEPHDRVTAFRVVQMLEGIGPTTAGKVLDRIAGREVSDALATFAPPAKAAAAWRDLVELVTQLRARQRIGQRSSIWSDSGISRTSSRGIPTRCTGR